MPSQRLWELTPLTEVALHGVSDDEFEHVVDTMETMTANLDAALIKGDPS